MKEYTLGFCTSPNNRVLLAYKDGKGPDGTGWNGIGGKLEEGETPLGCMAREWAEESALPPVDWEPRGFVDFGPHARVHLFTAVAPFAATAPTGTYQWGDVPTAWVRIADCLGNPLGARRLVSWAAVMLAMSLEDGCSERTFLASGL